MKNPRIFASIVLIMIVVSAAGRATSVTSWPIVLSVYPLSSNQQHVVFEPELLGTWEHWNFSLTFEQAGTGYLLTVVTRFGLGITVGGHQREVKEVSDTFTAHLVKVGKHLFLDLFPCEFSREYSHYHQKHVGHHWRLHSFMLVRNLGEKLCIGPVNGKELFSQKSGIRTVEQDGRVCVLSSTDELRGFLARQADLNAYLCTGYFECSKTPDE